MSRIVFSNGQAVNFNGNPTQADVEEVAAQLGISQQTALETPNLYGATFRATGNESGLEAGLKAAGNVPSSAFNFAKNIAGVVTSPIQTAKAIGGVVTDVGRKVTNKLTDITGLGQRQETPTLSALGGVFNERYGTSFGPDKFNLDTAISRSTKTAIEDPFGVGADILGVMQGGAALTGKTAQLNNILSKTAQVATAPIRVPVNAAVKATGATTRFGVSQATGLTPDTISAITKNPSAFGKAQAAGATRVDLADDVFTAIQKASDDLSDLGTGYNSVRESGKIVQLPDEWAISAVKKFGLDVQDSKVIANRASRTRNVTDINKIQSFIDNWGDAKNFTADEYLNMRHDLAELAKYDQAGSTVARDFAQTVREGVLNTDEVRNQIPGLKNLDAQYADDIKFYKSFQKDYLKPDGTFKDGAASKIVNSVNANNPERLARLEELYPGFTQKAKVIKAVEDVENAMGLKVGTYMRAGAGIAGAVTGNVPLLVSAILSVPEIAVPLLKGYGYTAKTVGPVLKAISDVSGDINNFRVPGLVKETLEKQYPDGVPVGMSTMKLEDFKRDLSLSPQNKAVEQKAFERIIAKETELIDTYFSDVKLSGKYNNIINTDNFRPLFKDDGYVGSNAAAVQEPSSYLSKKAYTQALATRKGDYVAFTAGGSGTGKSSALKGIPAISEELDNAVAVVDSNLSSYDSAISKIEEARKANKKVVIDYVYRDPLDSFENGVVKRMLTNPDEMGRLVPSKVVAGNHIDSLAVNKRLRDEGYAVRFVDNSNGPGKAKLSTYEEIAKKANYPSKEELTKRMNEIAKRLLDDGKITPEQYAQYIE